MKDQEVVISGIQDFLEFKYDGENIKIENFSHSNFVSNPFDQLTNEECNEMKFKFEDEEKNFHEVKIKITNTPSVFMEGP